ncbi:MAG: bifunctional [glutamine synthetase] adenylyltransferase/[glutamine synthetase]-adenylyl-L-tyrosine phosphorylase [Neomegalonema sp.]|nr:bifunctional [glutamine synthetase] adenylyltransferase/[glutamine synthetase]-adenylyl-L-tyrosine phosphorylase [Neomegalonema sp.]
MTRAEAERTAFSARITRFPRVHDERAGRECLEGLGSAAAALPPALNRLALGAAACAPFLAHLLRKDGAWLAEQGDRAPETILEDLLAEIALSAPKAPDRKSLQNLLRIARRRAALLIALADLGAVWPLAMVTDALTRFNDTALRVALDWLIAREIAGGKMPELSIEHPAIFFLAMGKMGAHELNYSSDIDLICLYDGDRFTPEGIWTAQERFPKLVRELVKILSEVTEEGYVARVDLRLRPDPGSTPVAMLVDAAERYYGAMGRTWERAAHIKARVVAGDIAAGEAYLQRLSPFIWRKHLDFAAIEDAATMLAKVREHKGGAQITFAGQDVKLGAGGIREIEFFAQTRQLILGGREPALRQRGTLETLASLVIHGLEQENGHLKESERAELEAAYIFERTLEHRIQMLGDQQTHMIPAQPEEIERLSALMDLTPATLEETTLSHMRAVRRIVSNVLDQPEEEEGAADTALQASPFPDPERAAAIIAGWTSGRLRAVRSERARASFERLTPEILDRLSAAGDPMHALVQFDRFLQGLPAGAQLFALFEAHPSLLDLLTEICAASPRLAAHLSRRSGVLDAVLDRGFFEALPGREALSASLERALARDARIEGEEDFERVLDTVRRWNGERRFQVGVGLLRGVTCAAEAARAFSDLAEVSLAALWPRVIADLSQRFGAPPGQGAALIAMGKLGSREMSAGSDLDLILIYDAEPTQMSQGRRQLAAPQYYARLTQNLTAALTAPTAEGTLYEVDMRLRPSGNSGPLATSLSSFERYQNESAWTWERMALTRARVIAGTASIGGCVERIIGAVLSQKRNAATVREDALDMRSRLDAVHAQVLSDPWAIKFTRGGIVDAEFITQTQLLIHGLGGQGGISTQAALDALAGADALSPAQLTALRAALTVLQTLQQIERVVMDGKFEPDQASSATLQVVLRALDCADADALEQKIRRAQAQIADQFTALIGPFPPVQ